MTQESWSPNLWVWFKSELGSYCHANWTGYIDNYCQIRGQSCSKPCQTLGIWTSWSFFFLNKLVWCGRMIFLSFFLFIFYFFKESTLLKWQQVECHDELGIILLLCCEFCYLHISFCSIKCTVLQEPIDGAERYCLEVRRWVKEGSRRWLVLFCTTYDWDIVLRVNWKFLVCN